MGDSVSSCAQRGDVRELEDGRKIDDGICVEVELGQILKAVEFCEQQSGPVSFWHERESSTEEATHG